jgi:hypothetical protein
MLLPMREAEYFSQQDWTTQITLIPNENFVPARNGPHPVARAFDPLGVATPRGQRLPKRPDQLSELLPIDVRNLCSL